VKYRPVPGFHATALRAAAAVEVALAG